MSKKILSVKVDKKKVMKENFEKKGLSELLSEVNFSIDTSEAPKKLMAKFISAVKKKFKPQFAGLNMEEKLEFLNNIKIHDIYQLKAELLVRESDKDFYANMESLLYFSQPKALRTKRNEVVIVKFTLTTGEEVNEAYGLLESEIGKNYHRSRRGYSGTPAIKKYGFLELVDVPSLIAETIALQSLFNFAEKKPDWVKYLFVKANMGGNFYYRVPEEEEFRKDFLAIAEERKIYTSSYRIAKELNAHQDIFYGTKKQIGDGRNPFREYLWDIVIAEFIQQSYGTQYNTNEELSARSDYAKTFEDKKHIKKTHQDRMRHNKILKWYGNIELDNEVDLNKFRIIEDNFIELDKHIHIPRRKDYGFRIKKLGKLRAAGVFYRYYKETIFDVNHPNAYVHELWHQIDAIMAEDLLAEDYYSETLEFREVLTLYKKLISEHVNSLPYGHEFRNQWFGKTKFNKDYFFKPTEIFARSGEVYVASLGLDNSLTKSKEEMEKEPVYTFEEEYVEAVKNFFEKLIVDLKNKEPKEVKIEKVEKTKRSALGISQEINAVEEPVGFEQLSFF